MSSIYNDIISWDNLWLAFQHAARGKRRGNAAAGFEHQVADRLIDLQRDLGAETYRPGAYTNFYIHEPKHRLISAAPFRDRVAHHALCNVITPIFEQRFIEHSYANRVGKGTHRALDCFQSNMKRYRYVLRGDIVEHFPSLDHAILRAEIATVIDDDRAMRLVDAILSSGAGVLVNEYTPVLFAGDDLLALARPRGLPIGNLTSQFWSNVYMNPFDWFVQRELGCAAYLRYVDDFALFSDSKQQLYAWKRAMIKRLARLRLTLHESQAQAEVCEDGAPWLGFVLYPTHRLLKRRNAVNFTQRLARHLTDYRAGRISFAELDAGVQGWINHVRYADTWGLRRHILSNHRIPGAARKITSNERQVGWGYSPNT